MASNQRPEEIFDRNRVLVMADQHLDDVYYVGELCASAPRRGVILGSVGEQLQDSRRRI